VAGAFSWAVNVTRPRLASLSALRNAAVLRLRVDLGLSPGALARLDIEDLDRPGRTVWIRCRGQLEKESRSLTRPILAALEEWLEIRGAVASVNETAVFVMISGRSRGRRMSGYNVVQVAGRDRTRRG
jgi:site-specific recombinase XerC